MFWFVAFCLLAIIFAVVIAVVLWDLYSYSIKDCWRCFGGWGMSSLVMVLFAVVILVLVATVVDLNFKVLSLEAECIISNKVRVACFDSGLSKEECADRFLLECGRVSYQGRIFLDPWQLLPEGGGG